MGKAMVAQSVQCSAILQPGDVRHRCKAVQRGAKGWKVVQSGEKQCNVVNCGPKRCIIVSSVAEKLVAEAADNRKGKEG